MSIDDEREALVAILEAPLTEESQGRTFSEMLADVILVQFGFRRSEPTDDEREARLEYVIDAAVPVSEFPSWRFRYSRRIADAVRAAGFRRTEPSTEDRTHEFANMAALMGISPQGEPSDARGIIARALMGEARMDTFSAWNLADAVLADLRAAGFGGVR